MTRMLEYIKLWLEVRRLRRQWMKIHKEALAQGDAELTLRALVLAKAR